MFLPNPCLSVPIVVKIFNKMGDSDFKNLCALCALGVRPSFVQLKTARPCVVIRVRRWTRQTVALTRWLCQNQMFGLHPNEKGQRMNRRASIIGFPSESVSVQLALACLISTLAASTHGQALLLKTETFDADPGWDERNNRASDPGPRQIIQNFGFDGSTTNAGGAPGEIGGFVTPAGEPAIFAKVI